MNTQELIDLRGIKKIFYTEDVETAALDNVDLTIRQGEYVSISGPSGCGKSTLLSVMGLLNSSTEGKYFLNGAEVTALSAVEQARVRNQEIGFIFQAFNLIADMTAFENVELPLTYRSDLHRKQRRELVSEALAKVEMTPRANHYPAQLSGGQQQRVAIARSLVNDPALILADEPTGNLDSRTSVEVMEIFQRLNRERGITLILVTHEHDIAEYADRVIVFKDGKIKKDYTIDSPRNAAEELRQLPASDLDVDDEEDEG